MKMIVTLLGMVLLAAFVQAEPIGMIVAIQGRAVAVDSGGASRTLAMKSDIALNDTIKTEADSRVQIMMLDDSLVSIGASSEMTIDEYVYNPADASDNAFGASLGKGVFRTVTGKITDMNPERFNVKTRRATIGIRGCDLGFDTTGADADQISVMAIPEGKKIFIAARQGKKTILVESPSFVMVSDRGGIDQRMLPRSQMQMLQQGTTPNAGTPNLEGSDPGGTFSDLLSETRTLTQGAFAPVVDSTVVEGTEMGESSSEHSYSEGGSFQDGPSSGY